MISSAFANAARGSSVGVMPSASLTPGRYWRFSRATISSCTSHSRASSATLMLLLSMMRAVAVPIPPAPTTVTLVNICMHSRAIRCSPTADCTAERRRRLAGDAHKPARVQEDQRRLGYGPGKDPTGGLRVELHLHGIALDTLLQCRRV